MQSQVTHHNLISAAFPEQSFKQFTPPPLPSSSEGFMFRDDLFQITPWYSPQSLVQYGVYERLSSARNAGLELGRIQRTWGAGAGEGKMLSCPQLLASLAGDSMKIACWIAQQVDLRTVWFVFKEKVGLMGVSPVPGVSPGSLRFFQTKSGLVVITCVSFLWVLKYKRGLNYGCRMEEMQSAAVRSLFYPLLQTTLNKGIARTQSHSCSFYYSGVFLSSAICLAAIFFLIPPLYLKRNVSVPQNTSCTSLTESPDDINSVSLQHASHDPLLACTACLGTPPLLLYIYILM